MKLNDKPGTQNGSDVQFEGNKNSGRQSNGNHENGTKDILKRLSDQPGLHGRASNSSESYGKLSVLSSKSGDLSESHSKSRDKSDIGIKLSDRSKQSKAYCVSRISKTKSINLDLRLSRGIAQVNEGKYSRAVAIFDQLLEEDPNYPEALIGRGRAYAFQRELDAAIADFTKAIHSNKSAGEAWKQRGQAQAALGQSVEAIADLTKALEFEPNSADILHERFYKELANSEKALECLQQLLQIDGRYAKAYHLRGLLLHGMEDHRNAIKDLTTGLSLENSNIECLSLRGSYYHAMGEYREAVKGYDAALDVELESMEKFVLQCLAFYQKEIVLYTASKINSEFSWFDTDGHIDPLFKEYWCRRLHPKNVCEKVYRQPPLRDSLRKSKLKRQEFVPTKQKTALLQAADYIGKKIQYHCPGFLSNSEKFNSGFGSHTPPILGQAKVVRYFPNFKRALNTAKEVMKEKKYVCSKTDDY